MDVDEEPDYIDPVTLEASRRVACSWDKPWPDFLDEFKRRVAVNGGTLDELAVLLTGGGRETGGLVS